MVLTSLIVYNFHPIPFHTPRLTRFKFWNGSGSIDEDKLLGFLNNCPLLEHMNILHTGIHQSGHDVVISLPRLLTYTETTSGEMYTLAVLNVLSLPPFCSVTLRSQSRGKITAESDDILPRFKNPDYLAKIKRVKLGTTCSTDGGKVVSSIRPRYH